VFLKAVYHICFLETASERLRIDWFAYKAGFSAHNCFGDIRSPLVIDFFVNNLRHNPYAEIGEHKSTEDEADMARRLKHTTVQIEDVRPVEGVGMIAIATLTQSQPMQERRRCRNYT
jgi:hypothetical protein